MRASLLRSRRAKRAFRTNRVHRSAAAAVLLATLASAALEAPIASSRPSRADAAASGAAARPLSVSVSANHLVSQDGAPVRLVGVDRSGSEYKCLEAGGNGVFVGPTGATSIAAMKSWDINAVRLPLNEDCWLGINGVNPAHSGPAYRNAVKWYVGELNAAGLYVILDVHWSAPGSELSQGQQKMLDASHGYTLWRSIATTFKHSPAVLFDLFNEPHDLGATKAQEWRCWADGCDGYAGMDGLVATVRSAGAANVILLAGLGWASEESDWLTHEPKDALHQLAVSFHVYAGHTCADEACWQQTIAPLAERVPVVADEFGDLQCGAASAFAWINRWMSYASGHGFSMLAWTWDAWPDKCADAPVLITQYNGAPTPFGAAVRAYYTSPALADGEQP